jgi:hypothetical protein
MRATKVMARSGRRRSARATFLPLLAAVLAATVGAPTAAGSKDFTPPKFAGLESAITCIPGPIGGGRTSAYTLSWDPATDDVTPARKIVYDVYQAERPGGQDFSAPTYTTRAGATSFTTPPLSTDRYFYFVVRARDRAGNSDSNTVERQGQNLCV